MLAIEVVSGLVFDAELRPGNVYTSNGMSDFQRPIIDRYKEQQTCLIRGDSGFATPKVYNLCDDNRTNLLIRLKTNARLTRLAESRILYGDETDFTLAECHYYDCLYQANTWDKPLRVIIKSTRSAGALLYRHEFLVTTRNYRHSGSIVCTSSVVRWKIISKKLHKGLRLIKQTAPHLSPIAPECF